MLPTRWRLVGTLFATTKPVFQNKSATLPQWINNSRSVHTQFLRISPLNPSFANSQLPRRGLEEFFDSELAKNIEEYKTEKKTPRPVPVG